MTQQGIFTRGDAHCYLDRDIAVHVDRLAPRVWTAAAGSHRSLFVEGDTSVIAVNALQTPAATRALAAAIVDAVPSKPLRTLVATVDHLDHSGYGQSLGAIEEVVAHDLTAAMIERRAAPGQLPATRVVRGDGELLELDGVRMRLRYPGPTMGTGNIGVHLPDANVLYIVGPQKGARYGLFPDFHLEQYVASMRRLLDEMSPGTVVPGRSEVMSADEARRAVDYVEALQATCQGAIAMGLPFWLVDVMHGHCTEQLGETWGSLDGFEEHVAVGGVRVVHHYLMGGWGLEDTQQPDLLLGRLDAPPA